MNGPKLDLNERNIKLAKPGETLWDSAIKGLHLRAFDNKSTFYVYFRTKTGQQRKPKLGDYGTLTLTQARRLAQDMMLEVANGRDPMQARVDDRTAHTLEDLFEENWKRRIRHLKSAAGQKDFYDRYAREQVGGKKITEITYSTVADLVEAMADKPIAANRTLALLSAMFNFGKGPLEWTEKNPCTGVNRYPEIKRRRYMKGEEPARIAEVLNREAVKRPAPVAFIYLLIFTGARSGEIAAARWEWLEGNVLNLPDSKTGFKPVHLPPQAMDVINRLPRTNGTITGIKSPKALWEMIRREVGCYDLRPHDLRHSFASTALGAGFSLGQIGELLGHKSTQTTQRYAHLVEEAAQAAVAATADRIMNAMSLPISDKPILEKPKKALNRLR
jgi:integrase